MIPLAKRPRRKSVPCLTCGIPANLRAEIVKARPSVSFTTISEWLGEHGFEIGDAAIAAHFRKGHER